MIDLFCTQSMRLHIVHIPFSQGSYTLTFVFEPGYTVATCAVVPPNKVNAGAIVLAIGQVNSLVNGSNAGPAGTVRPTCLACRRVPLVCSDCLVAHTKSLWRVNGSHVFVQGLPVLVTTQLSGSSSIASSQQAYTDSDGMYMAYIAVPLAAAGCANFPLRCFPSPMEDTQGILAHAWRCSGCVCTWCASCCLDALRVQTVLTSGCAGHRVYTVYARNPALPVAAAVSDTYTVFALEIEVTSTAVTTNFAQSLPVLAVSPGGAAFLVLLFFL